MNEFIRASVSAVCYTEYVMSVFVSYDIKNKNDFIISSYNFSPKRVYILVSNRTIVNHGKTKQFPSRLYRATWKINETLNVVLSFIRSCGSVCSCQRQEKNLWIYPICVLFSIKTHTQEQWYVQDLLEQEKQARACDNKIFRRSCFCVPHHPSLSWSSKRTLIATSAFNTIVFLCKCFSFSTLLSFTSF